MMGSGAETFTQLRGILKRVKDRSAMGSRVRVVIHSRDSLKKWVRPIRLMGMDVVHCCQFVSLSVLSSDSDPWCK